LNILVTGGAGFIGSHLVDRLLADGHHVKVIDNLVTGSEANLRSAREGYPSSGPGARWRFLGGDIMDDDLVAAAMRDSDLVYHLAAAVGVKYVVDDPLWALVTNSRGSENVLRRAFEAGTRVVFASTSEIYGESEAVPFDESGQRVLGPTWTHRWGYSTAKALDEHFCFAYAQRGMAVSVVRYFNVFGTRMNPNGYGSVLARFVTQAVSGDSLTVYGDGRQTRTFTHVADAVEATVRTGTLEQALGEAFNVGGREEVSILDVAERVREAAGAASGIEFVPYEAVFGPGFADTRRRVPSIGKAERILGWVPRVSLDEGLPELLAERREA
jgi:UDP-glucose 4-epimerase